MLQLLQRQSIAWARWLRLVWVLTQSVMVAANEVSAEQGDWVCSAGQMHWVVISDETSADMPSSCALCCAWMERFEPLTQVLALLSASRPPYPCVLAKHDPLAPNWVELLCTNRGPPSLLNV